MNKIEEIPFKALPQNRLIPWIIAMMCYITILALGGATYLNDAISTLQKTLEESVTIEMSSLHQGFKSSEATKNHYARQEKLLSVLKHHSKIDRAEIFSLGMIEKIANPWKAAQNDPLFEKPFLVDVYPKSNRTISASELEAYIGRSLQGVKVYAVHPWKQEILSVAWGLLIASLALACLVAFIATAIIMLTTHTGLSLHRKTLSILRLIGATNSFIFKRFQKYATSLALKGALWGMIPALLTFWAFLGSSLIESHPSLLFILFITPLLLTLLTFTSARASFSLTFDIPFNEEKQMVMKYS